MKKRPQLLWFGIIPFLFLSDSCKKKELDDTAPVVDQVEIRLKHVVDNAALEFDTMKYSNDAGNLYAVERLNYYLSDITFHTSDNRQIVDNGVHYVDGRNSSTLSIVLPHPGQGHIVSVTAMLGVPARLDTFGLLPNTLDNQNMLWPEFMGGGYHFLKFEGRFLYNSTSYGFAVHLGKNGFQSLMSDSVSFDLTGGSHVIEMKMNLNEVFRTPYTYDLNADGNYTMGDSTLMSRISGNAADMFTIQKLR